MKGSVFDSYSKYYDVLYNNKEYMLEVAYVEALLKKYRMNISSILEFGSGTGRHGCEFGRRGYSVVGVEHSSEMMVRAETSNNFKIFNGDIRTVRFDQRFDAVISLFHVISYLNSNSDVAEGFRTASEHLNSGGIFLFDFWFSPAVLFQGPTVRVKRVEDSKTRIVRIAEPKRNDAQSLVSVNYTVIVEDKENKQFEILEERHNMRHFTLNEIECFANQAGFQLIHSEEWLTGATPNSSTWGVCVVLMKK